MPPVPAREDGFSRFMRRAGAGGERVGIVRLLRLIRRTPTPVGGAAKDTVSRTASHASPKARARPER